MPCRFCSFVFAFLAVGLQLDNSQGGLHTVALSGQSPDPQIAQTLFKSFSSPSLNNFGQVAFSATLEGQDVTSANDSGVWIASEGGFGLVAREGDAAPEPSENSLFGSLPDFPGTSISLSDTGEVAFRSRLHDTVTSEITGAIWAGNADALRPVAYTGMPAPGAAANETFYASNARVSMSRTGIVAFAANYFQFQGSVDRGFWIETELGLLTIAAAGTAVPDSGENTVFSSLPSVGETLVNTSGQVAFRAILAGDGISTQNDESVWVGGATGSLIPVTREPMPVESLGPDVTVRAFSPSGISASGAVSMLGTLAGPGVENPRVQLVATQHELTIIARQGDPAPGAPEGHVFGTFDYAPVIGSAEHVAFYGNEWESGNLSTIKSGIWAGNPGELALIVREGDMAPGQEATFGWFFRDTPAINRLGQVAFYADLRDVETQVISPSIWATDIDGVPVLIARKGNLLEVGPGDERTVESLRFQTFHGDDGRPRSLNDLGQVAFRATFTDGTEGLFLSNRVASLPGDFNHDGVVNAADYPVWRDNSKSDAEYQLWRDFYGRSFDLPQDGTEINPIPEPAGWVLAAIVMLIVPWRRLLTPARP